MAALELIGGAALGTAFSELWEAISDAKEKTLAFTSLLEKVEETLNSLKPIFEDINELNKKLVGKPESKDWINRLKDGENLVEACSRVCRWNLWKRYVYAKRLEKFDESLKALYKDMKANEARDVKEILVTVKDMHKNMVARAGAMVLGGCKVPEPPELCVGLEKHVRELKIQLLQAGVSVLLLSGPGGCGKTTLVKKLCQDEAIKGKFKDKIFYVTVSQKTDLKLIIQKILNAGLRMVPSFETDEEAVDQLGNFLKGMEPNPILLVLDNVWSGSESIVEKFKFQLLDYKILVTSRSEFPQFDYLHHLEPLNDEDAISLFFHSAIKKDEEVNSTKQHLIEEIVGMCKGHPLALTVIGKSLRGQRLVTWQRRVRERPSPLSDNDVLSRLQSGLDLLDPENEGNSKECFMDMASFPEDHKIPATALIDVWGEMYDMDVVDAMDTIHRLCSLNLASLVIIREDPSEAEGYFDKHFITQHDLLKELAILQSSQKEIHQRERLYIDISGNDTPFFWIGNKQQQLQHVHSSLRFEQPFNARLLSIFTDKTFSSHWYDMELPNVEVLLLNFEATNLNLPQFMRKMDKLKALVLTKLGFFPAEISNFQFLGSVSGLRRMRLEQVSLPSLTKNKVQMKNLQKISLVMCKMGLAFSNRNTQISDMFPYLEEIEIDYCNDLIELPWGICKILRLKRLSVTNCPKLSALPKELGKLKNLEVLRLQSCSGLLNLPDSIGNLQNLRFLDISDCVNITKLQEKMGGLCSLMKLYMGGCSGLQQLPQSFVNFNGLEVVICDEVMVSLWEEFKPYLKNLVIEVRKEEANLNWLRS